MPLDLDRFPRVALAHWPSPLEEAPRLAGALGLASLSVKRDDLSATGAGGNKIRKLEFLLGRALADGADTVVTFGAVQTNHGRQTAAACARLGLRCELVLTALVPRSGEVYEGSGNVLLDRVFGANVHLCADGAATGEAYQRVLAEAAAEGRVVATVPLGGSDAVGALGYVAAAAELGAQLGDPRGGGPVRVVVPCSSGGTVAGLALGSALLDLPLVLDVACVAHPAEETRAEVERLVRECAALLGVDPPGLGHVHFGDATLGAGYGIPDERVWEAIGLVGRTAGVALDPVYSGKAAAALVHAARSGAIGADERIVFLHTGGLPALFAYASEYPPRA